jgi:hypothetical protein
VNTSPLRVRTLIPAVVLAFAACRIETRKADPPAPASSNLIENGDFESYLPQAKPSRWRFDPEALFSWASTSSGAGDRSVALDASRVPGPSPDRPSRTAEASILAIPDPAAVKPGAAYLFEASFLRDRHIDGIYPSIDFFGESVRISDLWSAGTWKKITLLRPAPGVLPVENRVLKISFPAGDYRIRIDDLRLVAFTPRPEPDPTRISWTMPATDRLVEFRVRIAPSRRDLDAAETSGRGDPAARDFVSTNSDRYPTPAGVDRIVYSFDPKNRLPAGRYFWRVAVYLGRALLSLSEPRVIIVPSEVTPGTDVRSVSPAESESAGGAPFPIGIYGAIPSEYRELAAAGFTAVQSSAPDGKTRRTVIEAAAEAGLKLLLNPPDPLPDIGETADAAKTMSDADIVWYLDDEPEGRSVSPKEIFDKRAALRRAGLQQPGAISLLRSWRTPDYAAAADIFLSDPYPIPFEPLSWLSRCLDEIRGFIGTSSDKQVWAVIQAFDWNTVSPAAAATGRSRPPSFPEIRALTYLALIHRAEGIMFYPGGAGAAGIRSRPELWIPLKALVAEIQERLPILALPESRLDLSLSCSVADTGGWPAVHALLKDDGSGRIILLAVNTVDITAEASFSLGTGPAGKTIRQVFAPLEVKVVRTEDLRSGADPIYKTDPQKPKKPPHP